MCAHTIVLEVTGYSLCVWGREREREKRKNVAIIKIKASSWHLFPRPFQPLQGLKRCRENNPLNRNWKLRQRVGTSDLFLSRGSNPFDSSPLFIPVMYRSSIGIFSSSSYSHSLLQRIGRVIVQESKDRLEEAQNRIDEIEIFRGRQTRRFDYATNNLFFSSSFVPYFFRFLLFDHPRVNARASLSLSSPRFYLLCLSRQPTDRASNQPTGILSFFSFHFSFTSAPWISFLAPLLSPRSRRSRFIPDFARLNSIELSDCTETLYTTIPEKSFPDPELFIENFNRHVPTVVQI